MGRLILARHGKTEYNLLGLWTGLTQVDLVEEGVQEAHKAGRILQPITIDKIFVSELRRTPQTAKHIISYQANAENIPVTATANLNERDYGIYTGMNKQQVLAEKGEAEFLRIRRSWDGEIEGGQTLKDVHDNQILPFHRDVALPHVLNGETVLVISSNNPLRAYVKMLEDVPIDEVADIALGTAEIRIYDFDDNGTITGKTVHQVGDVH